MKKLIGFLSFVVVLTAISCTDRTTEVKKEVIVVPAATPAPAVVVKEAPATPTTISVDKNGVKVQTKKIDVKVNN